VADTNLGKWDPWYASVTAPGPYGDSVSYQLCADWLRDCALVEDWGCGTGWLRRLIRAGRYRGVDGSWSPFADEIADLTVYRSHAEGICMRHVLEHNPDWRLVLSAAAASFTRRMALVLFTPMGDITQAIAPFSNGPVDVPNISFRHEDLTELFPGDCAVTFADLDSPETFYHCERIYYLERP
jgi:hypothetical protein